MTQTVLWQNDNELFEMVRSELYTAVVGDIMDTMGLTHQFLPPRIRPLRDDMFLVGRAMTVLEADCMGDATRESLNPALCKPFGLMLEALDDLKPNEVYLCTGASPSYALWGELMATRAIQCGAAGVVTDGYSRDTRGVLKLALPTFSYGSYAQDQEPRGKVIDYRCRLEIEGVTVQPGDTVVGDIDGVCVVPQKAEEEVFRRALEKARGEKTVKKAIEGGMTAQEAFDTYGII
jgi:regulator of RNase E activity RraA